MLRPVSYTHLDVYKRQVRYDTFLENSSESASRQTNYTAGVVWQPVKYLRCQLNYTYEDYASRAAANRNVVSLMLSGIF